MSDSVVASSGRKYQLLIFDWDGTLVQLSGRLFEGVEPVLQLLSEQGYYLAVATGMSRRGLDQDLRNLALMELFPITRTADETFSKPHPLMLEEIVTDYDTCVEAALMVGDTEYDLQMAANAGMDSLAVSYGVHTAERLLKQRPQGLIEQFAQLPAWLNNLNKQIDKGNRYE